MSIDIYFYSILPLTNYRIWYKDQVQITIVHNFEYQANHSILCGDLNLLFIETFFF